MKCSFCHSLMRSGTGKMFVKNDGTIYYWCSKKCERNFLMNRNPKNIKWVGP